MTGSPSAGLATDADPGRATGYPLFHGFRRLVSTRGHAALESWLTDAEASDLVRFVSFAHGVRADRAAVDAALAIAWFNVPTEGHVHRLKMIWRQVYGRAKFDMLRRCMLAC